MVETGGLCTLDEIIRVNGNAMSADSAAWPVRHESVGFGRGAFDHVRYVYIESVEGFRQLVHERDVDVAKRVLHDFYGFRFADRIHWSYRSVDYVLIEFYGHV